MAAIEQTWFACPFCDEEFTSAAHQVHVQTCFKISAQCPFEGCQVKTGLVSETALKNHIMDCDKLRLKCKTCFQIVSARDLVNHISVDCQKALLERIKLVGGKLAAEIKANRIKDST